MIHSDFTARHSFAAYSDIIFNPSWNQIGLALITIGAVGLFINKFLEKRGVAADPVPSPPNSYEILRDSDSTENPKTPPSHPPRPLKILKPLVQKEMRANFRMAHQLMKEAQKKSSLTFLHFSEKPRRALQSLTQWECSDDGGYNALVKKILENDFHRKVLSLDNQSEVQSAMAVTPYDSSLFIDYLVSAPKNAFREKGRQRGSGVSMMIEAARVALVYGKRYILLNSTDNAKSFYKKLGFQELEGNYFKLPRENFMQLVSHLPIQPDRTNSTLTRLERFLNLSGCSKT